MVTVVTSGEPLGKENATVIERITFSKNTFLFWDVQAPPGYVVSVFFQQPQIEGAWDGYMFISLGDNEANFNNSTDSCDPWIQVTKKGIFQKKYQNFTSRSSSVKIIFSSFTTEATFSIRLQAMISQGN